jgi:hypothetical protein
MNEWAKNEVELAKIANSKDGDELDGYVCACYESALNVFNLLCSQGHSGMSIKITEAILVRLIAGKPLTPIEDNEDVWSDRSYERFDGTVTCQCKRMSSLFKNIDTNGNISYYDVDRITCENVDSGISYYSSLANRLYNKTHPITFPYYPASKPVTIFVRDFLYDPKNGDFDTVAILYALHPDGNKEEINKYFKEAADHTYVEISKEEYEERYSAYMERIEHLLSNEEDKADGKVR